MGYRLMKFEVIPEENQQLELTVQLPEEPRSVIHGVVKDCKDKPLKDAVVKLFEVINPCDPCSLKPLTHAFTDECGQFLFGPLCPHKKYVIKVWHDHVNIKPIIIRPSICDDSSACEKPHHCDESSSCKKTAPCDEPSKCEKPHHREEPVSCKNAPKRLKRSIESFNDEE